jgi:1-phosphofructokinase family hexose kinase
VIVTVTANAAVDRTLHVERLVPGAAVVAHDERVQAGGKGVNVARVLYARKVPVTAVVLVAGEAGDWILADLARDGIPAVAVRAPGTSRTCLEIVSADGGVTQVHAPGPAACEATARALVAACAEAADGAHWLAWCGSAAPGLPPDVAARALAAARAAGAATALDTRGPGLAAGVATRPDLLRVNRQELREGLGLEPEQALADARTAQLPRAVVSSGAGPVLAWTGSGERYRITPPPVALRNPVGCGDAMMAGLLAALTEGVSFETALRRSVALAAAEAESPCAGRPDAARADALVPQTRLEALS